MDDDPDIESADYCDYCETEGHTFRQCPARDDDPEHYDDEYSTEYDLQEPN